MNEQNSRRFLVVDDESSSSLILSSLLEGEGFRCEIAKNEPEMFEHMGRYSYDAVFLDYKLGKADGLSLVPRILREHPYCHIIMITAHGSVDLAVKAIQNGVSGFIEKPFDEGKVLGEIKKISKKNRETTSHLPDSGILGKSPEIKRILEQIQKMKDADSTVLVFGESGTGKELVARALHLQSKRCEGRFEAINCAAIPESLLESELFGVKKGAYTDARQDRKGLFEICTDGTLFLDEIGEMPLHLQAKLLRVLQEKEVTPLGSSNSVKVKTRVVAATNQNLDRLVRNEKFRKDLYYRVSVLQVVVPPLRDRAEDIEILARAFQEKISSQMGKKLNPMSEGVVARLNAYDWPGNVRELYNSLERAIVLSEGGQLNGSDIFAHLQLGDGGSDISHDQSIKSLSDAKEEFESSYLERLLASTQGNVARAAKVAGRLRTDMYRLFTKHNIDPSKFKSG